MTIAPNPLFKISDHPSAAREAEARGDYAKAATMWSRAAIVDDYRPHYVTFCRASAKACSAKAREGAAQ
jgi:hypothetical protein